jgi:hypothetical protein
MSLEPLQTVHIEGDDAARWREIWRGLSGAARDTLTCLCKHGPTYDGNVPSKSGRDELLQKKLAAKVVLANCEQGFQAATYLGSHVWKSGQALRDAQ